MVQPGAAIAEAPPDLTGIAGARTEVEHSCVPPFASNEVGQPLGVERVGASLQAMQQQDLWGVRLA